MTINEIIKGLSYVAPTNDVKLAAIDLIKIAANNLAGGKRDSYIVQMNITEYKEFQEYKRFKHFEHGK